MADSSLATDAFLICRGNARLCALPLESVVETMRPLPVRPLAEMPSFVLGVSIIRGAAVPVLDGAMLVGTKPDGEPARFVVLRTGTRHVCLAMQEVIGVRHLPRASLAGIPPLLQQAGTAIVSALGTLDAELLVVLQGGRLLADDLWSAVTAAAAATGMEEPAAS
jgi:purine-binding chemotaxis protein CheW